MLCGFGGHLTKGSGGAAEQLKQEVGQYPLVTHWLGAPPPPPPPPPLGGAMTVISPQAMPLSRQKMVCPHLPNFISQLKVPVSPGSTALQVGTPSGHSHYSQSCPCMGPLESAIAKNSPQPRIQRMVDAEQN